MTKRDEYIEEMKARLDQINAEIDALEVKTKRAKEDVKAEYAEEIAVAREKRNNLQQQLEELKSAGETAMDDLKQGAENAWQEAQQAVSRAAARFKQNP
jgi:chromosome segregation ATPase